MVSRLDKRDGIMNISPLKLHLSTIPRKKRNNLLYRVFAFNYDTSNYITSVHGLFAQ